MSALIDHAALRLTGPFVSLRSSSTFQDKSHEQQHGMQRYARPLALCLLALWNQYQGSSLRQQQQVTSAPSFLRPSKTGARLGEP